MSAQTHRHPHYGNPNTNNANPAAIATYCLPSRPNDTGIPRMLAPSCVSHNGFPVSASSAKKLPSSVPPNTSPPAVDNRLLRPAESSLNSHFNLPVVASSARTALHPSSPLIVRPPPAVKPMPTLYTASPL